MSATGPNAENPAGQHENAADYMDVRSAEPMLRWFDFEHLPEPMRSISQMYSAHARVLVGKLERSPERTVALRKLLESKDAAVRASLPA